MSPLAAAPVVAPEVGDYFSDGETLWEVFFLIPGHGIDPTTGSTDDFLDADNTLVVLIDVLYSAELTERPPEEWPGWGFARTLSGYSGEVVENLERVAPNG